MSKPAPQRSAASYEKIRNHEKNRQAGPEFAEPFRVTNGKSFRLKDVDPGDTLRFKREDKPRAKEALAIGVQALAELQDMLYAQDKWAVLLIFQAMDAAGKDGAIKHVMSGVNPQGCQVYSFKAPSSRGAGPRLPVALHEVPARARPHRHLQPQLLRGDAGGARAPGVPGASRSCPPSAGRPRTSGRSASRTSATSSATSTRNGVVVRKFFLHVSKKEQKRRFLERIENPEKNWKFSASDAAEREHWDEYMEAYEDMIRHTATKDAPWYVVPADNKWFTRVVVAAAVIDALASLDLKYPEVGKDKLKELAAAKQALLEEVKCSSTGKCSRELCDSRSSSSPSASDAGRM